METFNSPVIYATLTEIGQSDILSVSCVGQIMLEMLHRKIIDRHHGLTLIHFLTLGVAHLMLLNLYVVFIGEIT